MSLVRPCHYCFLWSKILGNKSHPGQLDSYPETLTTPCASQGGGGGYLEILGNASSAVKV
jgi:hypothetical protein